uniref:Ubiquitin carboxyl-terminal hydrolase CYLD isoform X2 n=1 Tax=Drosophila rhopaloa TaxID=1041015 RepID=A0A6P4G1H4_DRORH
MNLYQKALSSESDIHNNIPLTVLEFYSPNYRPKEPGFTIADYQPLNEIPGTELAIGSLVEVSSSAVCEDLYGVIRWIGIPPGTPKNVLVGIEAEDESNLKNVLTSDGKHNGVRYDIIYNISYIP